LLLRPNLSTLTGEDQQRPIRFIDSPQNYLGSTISTTSGLGSNYTTNTSGMSSSVSCIGGGGVVGGGGGTQPPTPSPRRKLSITANTTPPILSQQSINGSSGGGGPSSFSEFTCSDYQQPQSVNSGTGRCDNRTTIYVPGDYVTREPKQTFIDPDYQQPIPQGYFGKFFSHYYRPTALSGACYKHFLLFRI